MAPQLLTTVLTAMSDHVDVAIIGCGPVGATLANLLGQYGVRVVVLDREGAVHHSPRAASLDAEAMRIFQSFGVGDAIAAGASVGSGMRFVDARGRLLMHWQRRGTSPEGWATAYRIHQPAVESILREAAARLPSVRTLLRTEAEAVREVGGKLEIAFRERATGVRGALTADWVVGCDGARSLVRQAIGGGLRELGPCERWMVLDLLAHAGPDWTAEVGDSVQHCDPARPATVIPLVGRRRRWEFMLRPGEDDAEMLAPARIWELLRPWQVGPDQARIERAVVYSFHAVVARQWRAGSVLLAGDAAHQMPPFLGQGLCAGLRDAANLAWKLAGVVRGDYDASILDSYQSERALHVEAVIGLAVRIGGIIQTTDPDRAAERDRVMTEAPEALRVVMPPLGPGLHGAAPPPAGARAPQLILGDGVRLDDRAGCRFAVVALPALLEQASAASRAAWHAVDACVIPADGEAPTWLAQIARAAVIVRPDRAILATASTPHELDAASTLIPWEGSIRAANRIAVMT